jgi:signal transduction histidine kinase
MAGVAADLLVEPLVRLESVERRKARLLASLLLCVVVLGSLSAVVQLALIPGFGSTFAAMLAALSVLLLAYAGSRTRFYRVSAALAAAAPALACIAVGAKSPDDRVWYAFILIAVILTTLFFSVRTAAWVAVAVFASLCLLPIWVVELREPGRIVPLLALHGILSPLLLVGARHQAAMELEGQLALARLDARLATVEKLETFVRAASKTAHDFNNLLMVIAANVDAVQGRSSAFRTDEFAEIQLALERASLLGRKLLTSSREDAVSTCDVAEVVRGFEPLLARLSGPRVDVKLEVERDLPRVRAVPQSLEQALMNLATNARDAMPRGGSLSVQCRRIVVDAEHASAYTGACEGDHVVIAVTDTGEGIAPALLERVFEPFFTTKPSGRGTGLGLAIVREVVAQAGGHVSVESERGRGTTFRLFFPAF